MKKAPEYSLHRENITVVDTTSDNVHHGINSSGFRKVNVQVVARTADANPAASVLFWSEAAGEFIQAHTALDFAAAGTETPFEFVIEPSGRIFFIALTGTLTGGVDVYVSGFDEVENH
jgi:hypothetical protein